MKKSTKSIIGVFCIIVGAGILAYLMALGVLCFGPKIFGHTEPPFYHIGDERVFDDGSKVFVEQDFDNERFVYTHTNLEESDNNYVFCFDMTYFNFDTENMVTMRNSDEFIYTDATGNEIVFDENGDYNYQNDTIIYISYKNVSEEVKTVILKDKFDLYCSSIQIKSRKGILAVEENVDN